MSWLGKFINGALRAAPLRLWAMILAGPPVLGVALWLVTIIKSGEWPLALRGKQLDFLGWALLSFIAITAVIIVALASVRVKGSGPGGTSIEIDADNPPPVTTVTTTVEAKTE